MSLLSCSSLSYSCLSFSVSLTLSFSLLLPYSDATVIKARLKTERYYLTPDMFKADIQRMVANAKQYNAENTVYYQAAQELEEWLTTRWAQIDWPPRSSDMGEMVEEDTHATAAGGTKPH
jgi:hypothetical protein